MQKAVYWTSLDTERGTVILMATEKGLCFVGTPGTTFEEASSWVKKNLKLHEIVRNDIYPVLQETADNLKKYFAGKQITFDGPYDLHGSAFQKKIWEAISKIPYGETVTYGSIARALGAPKASRAVGAACGTNPVAIVIPCHRVVGSTGKLTGYGGGLPTKEWLLALEKKSAIL